MGQLMGQLMVIDVRIEVHIETVRVQSVQDLIATLISINFTILAENTVFSMNYL